MNFRPFGRFAFLSGALAMVILVGCVPQAPVPPTAMGEKPIELKAVTIADLDREIASHKGEVVVIDVWFLGCAPCVKRFPKVVELHKELRGEGVVFMTLNVYEEELKIQDKVLGFLKEKGADMTNFIVKDDITKRDAWQKKYDADATPSYVIFDRKGKWIATPQPEDKENMTRILKKLLAEK